MEIRRKQIRPEFLIKSEKFNIVGKVFLSEETIELFKKYWNIVPKSEYAFSSPHDQTNINRMLKAAAKKAGVKKKLTQHSLRKLWITSAINLGLPEIVYKILTFKSVSQDMLTYFLDREDLRDYWKKVTDFLALEPQANGRITNIEELVDLMLQAWKKAILKEMKKTPIAFGITGDETTVDSILKEMSAEELLKLFVEPKKN